MDQRKIDLVRQKMMDMGFWHKYTHIQAMDGIVAFVVADRCSLEKQQVFSMSIAFTKEQLDAEGFIDYKINTMAKEYDLAMKPFGGFERADLRVSP